MTLNLSLRQVERRNALLQLVDRFAPLPQYRVTCAGRSDRRDTVLPEIHRVFFAQRQMDQEPQRTTKR